VLFLYWIYRIVTNLCLDNCGGAKRARGPSGGSGHSGGEIDVLASVSDTGRFQTPARSWTARCGRAHSIALDKLTPRERMVLN